MSSALKLTAELPYISPHRVADISATPGTPETAMKTFMIIGVMTVYKIKALFHSGKECVLIKLSRLRNGFNEQNDQTFGSAATPDGRRLQ